MALGRTRVPGRSHRYADMRGGTPDRGRCLLGHHWTGFLVALGARAVVCTGGFCGALGATAGQVEAQCILMGRGLLLLLPCAQA